MVPSVAVSALWALQGSKDADTSIEQVFDWERDRLFTLAKGLAAFAVAVLTTLIVDAVEGNQLQGSSLAVWAAAALVALLMIWAGFIVTGLRRLSEQYAIAIRDYGGNSK
jgi:hypothetical protein